MNVAQHKFLKQAEIVLQPFFKLISYQEGECIVRVAQGNAASNVAEGNRKVGHRPCRLYCEEQTRNSQFRVPVAEGRGSGSPRWRWRGSCHLNAHSPPAGVLFPILVTLKTGLES